jgi:hypothetical protein
MSELMSDQETEERINNLIAANRQLPTAISGEDNPFVNGVTAISDEISNQMMKGSSITPSDVAELKKAEAFIFSTYTDVRQFRPLINKVTSVLSNGKFPTADAKFWQCKAEAEVHFNELRRDLFKHDRSTVDIEEIAYKIASMEVILNNNDIKDYDKNLIGFDLRRLQTKKDQYKFELKQLEKTMKYRIEEITDWKKISEEFEGQCNYSTKNPNEHVADTHLKVLTYHVQLAKKEERHEDFKIYSEQLKTFINLLKSSKKVKAHDQ